MLDQTGNQLTGRQEFEDFDIALFREGDRIPFKFVFDLLKRSVFKYAVSVLQSQEDAEDLVSQAFYDLFHARHQMHSLHEIILWLWETTKSSTNLLLAHRNPSAGQSKMDQSKKPTLPNLADWLTEASKGHKLN